MTWTDYAACRGMDASLFFPVTSEYAHPKAYARNVAPAKAICRACPSQAPCLAYAVGFGSSLHGIWGGTSERDRLNLRTGTDRRTEGRPRTPINHGTDAGYRAHYRLHEPPCDACRIAHNVYEADNTFRHRRDAS